MALARGFGADDATTVTADQVLIDPRIRFKCMFPRCYMSGGCSHCPPHGYSVDQVREIVSAHEWGVFFRVKIPPEIVAAKGLVRSINRGVMDEGGALFNLGAHYLLVFSIVRLLRKRLREMGYSSYGGFAAGNCKDALCHFRPVCRDLTTNQGCRHPGLSSPSLESCGIDAFSMAARAGWTVYPIGGRCEPNSIGHGSLMGLVLAADGDSPAPEFSTDPSGRKNNRPASAAFSIRNAGKSLAAIRKANAGMSQAPAAFRNRKVWNQFIENLHAIEESWPRTLKTISEMFAGQP